MLYHHSHHNKNNPNRIPYKGIRFGLYLFYYKLLRHGEKGMEVTPV